MIANKTFVLDASCAVKPMLGEQGKEKVLKIFYLKEKYSISLLMPELFRYEFISTISREKNAEDARQAFERFSARQVSYIPFDMDLAKIAFNLMEKYHGATFYDTSYHALAKVYKTFLVTADKRYYNLTRNEGDVKLLEKIKI